MPELGVDGLEVLHLHQPLLLQLLLVLDQHGLLLRRDLHHLGLKELYLLLGCAKIMLEDLDATSQLLLGLELGLPGLGGNGPLLVVLEVVLMMSLWEL